MSTRQKLVLLLAALLACPGFSHAAPLSSDLDANFRTPPAANHPETWWDWMNGNITRVGITADLEAMHRIRVQGATIVTLFQDIPKGPIPTMSPEFMDMVDFATKEAHRLGMNIAIANCSGWSSSGGPWVTPEHSMKAITTSKTFVTGPSTFNGLLPQPLSRRDYYKDVAVLAFKTGLDNATMQSATPKVTCSLPDVDVSPLVKFGSNADVSFPPPTRGPDQSIQMEFNQPFTARTLIVTSGSNHNAPAVIEASDDGRTFRALQRFSLSHNLGVDMYVPLGDAPVTAKFFRIRLLKEGKNLAGAVLRKIDLSPGMYVSSITRKALYEDQSVEPSVSEHDAHVSVPDDVVIHSADTVNLTSSLHPDGSLTWQVPAGNWTIMRVGQTTTGVLNRPGVAEATGLECDKLSRDGLDASWAGMMQPILDRTQSLVGTTVDASLVDSYEVGGQNWTDRMADEFRKRRGYDLTPFLPAFSGRIVNSPEQTERFLWDLRLTISELFADNYYDYFTELCHKHGITSMIEPYTGPFESIRMGAKNDLPMAEFWAGSNVNNAHPSLKPVASSAHIYGHAAVGAEAFTGVPAHGSWTDDLFSLKATGDMAFCAGINRFVFHRFAHQPWMDKFPGMTMGQWGINFDRTNTWFESAGPWITYLSRSGYLLQQGKSVSDVAFFCGESSPSLVRDSKMPAGYADDSINRDVLMNHASVKNHRLVLDTGISYALLALPESDPNMQPDLLQKLHDFVNEGLTIVGPRPEHSPSLANYPACDEQVKTLADEMWANTDGKNVTEHVLGQGKVIVGQPLATVLKSLNVGPDFSVEGGNDDDHFGFNHRHADDGEIYFIANHKGDTVDARCSFRVTDRVPELFNADTGEVETVGAYTVQGGCTTLPIHFDPSGSVFVVFRKASPGDDHVVGLSPDSTHVTVAPDQTYKFHAFSPGKYSFITSQGHTVAADASDLARPVNIAGPWEVTFPPNWGAPEHATFDTLLSWPTSTDKGIKYFSGTATYTKTVAIPTDLLVVNHPLYLDLGEVKNMAQVIVNGKDLGILWKTPFQIDISSAVRPGENTLEIKVTNLWCNRLAGDEQLPSDVEWNGLKLLKWPQWLLDGKTSPAGRLTFSTWHHINKESPLLPSGLLGPVQLHPTALIPLK